MIRFDEKEYGQGRWNAETGKKKRDLRMMYHSGLVTCYLNRYSFLNFEPWALDIRPWTLDVGLILIHPPRIINRPALCDDGALVVGRIHYGVDNADPVSHAYDLRLHTDIAVRTRSQKIGPQVHC